MEQIGTEAQVRAIFARLQAQVQAAAGRTVCKMAEDMRSRAYDLAPKFQGHLMQSGTTDGPFTSGDQVYARVGFAATTGQIGPKKPRAKRGQSRYAGERHSKKSPREREKIERRRSRHGGGSQIVSYAIITHEKLAWSKGPPGMVKNRFEMGRSGTDSGGLTLDEDQLGVCASDGDRGGKYLERPRRNTQENRDRFYKFAKSEFSQVGR